MRVKFNIISYAVMVRYVTRILNLNISPTSCELTDYLVGSCKNVPVLIHLTQWNIVFSPRRKWHWPM